MYYTTIFLLGGAGAESNPLPTFLFMGAIFFVMYFFMIRPQTKKAKEQRNFIDSLKKGDRVVTVGGIHGRISKVAEDFLIVDVDRNTRLKIEKSVISVDFTNAMRQRKQAHVTPEKEETQQKELEQ